MFITCGAVVGKLVDYHDAARQHILCSSPTYLSFCVNFYLNTKSANNINIIMWTYCNALTMTICTKAVGGEYLQCYLM